MAPTNNDRSSHANRVTRSSERGKISPNPAASNRAAPPVPPSPKAERSRKRKTPSIPVARASKIAADTDDSSKTETTPHEEEPPTKRLVDEPALRKDAHDETNARVEGIYGGNEEEERKDVDNENDEAILSRTINNLHDPYLQMVLSVLLREHRENQAMKRARGNRLRSTDGEAIVPKNLNPSPLQFEQRATEFVRGVVRTKAIQTRPGPCSSVVSELTDPHASSFHTRKPLETYLSHHELRESEDEVPYTIKDKSKGTTRTGHRRVRGICRHCKKKTKWFCPTCRGSHGAKRAWYCHARTNSVCHEVHLQWCEELFHNA